MEEDKGEKMILEEIKISKIDEPDEPHRLEIDNASLEELAMSIKSEGLKVPISLRKRENGRYEVIAGHRRLLACRMLGWETIPAFIREDTEEKAEVERMIENMQREGLSPMEEALAVVRYMDKTGKSAKDVAKEIGKTEHWVQTRVELMMLPDTLKEEVHKGRLAIASALHLAKVSDNAHREYLTRYAIEGGASATVIREWVNAWILHKDSGSEEPAPTPEWRPGDAEVIVQIPCAMCEAPTDHRTMAIIRICKGCLSALQDAKRNSQ